MMYQQKASQEAAEHLHALAAAKEKQRKAEVDQAEFIHEGAERCKEFQAAGKKSNEDLAKAYGHAQNAWEVAAKHVHYNDDLRKWIEELNTEEAIRKVDSRKFVGAMMAHE